MTDWRDGWIQLTPALGFVGFFCTAIERYTEKKWRAGDPFSHVNFYNYIPAIRVCVSNQLFEVLESDLTDEGRTFIADHQK